MRRLGKTKLKVRKLGIDGSVFKGETSQSSELMSFYLALSINVFTLICVICDPRDYTALVSEARISVATHNKLSHSKFSQKNSHKKILT